MDTVTREKRSEIMRSIRSKWTLPERRAHAMLSRAGVRHEMHLRMKWHPDILLKGARTLIFLDGCFWHGCPRHCKTPKSNRGYWLPKLRANIKRDSAANCGLRRSGWRVVRIWECRLSSRLLLGVAGARSATGWLDIGSSSP